PTTLRPDWPGAYLGTAREIATKGGAALGWPGEAHRTAPRRIHRGLGPRPRDVCSVPRRQQSEVRLPVRAVSTLHRKLTLATAVALRPTAYQPVAELVAAHPQLAGKVGQPPLVRPEQFVVVALVADQAAALLDD